MNAYSKLIVACIGLVILLLEKFTSLKFADDTSQKIADIVVAVGTAFSVWRVTNKTSA